MDRSQRVFPARRYIFLLFTLAAIIGCQGRTAAPAPVAAHSEEPLVRRMASADPAAQLPPLLAAHADSHTELTGATSESNSGPLEAVSAAVPVAALEAEPTPQQGPSSIFSISNEDTPQQCETSHNDDSADHADKDWLSNNAIAEAQSSSPINDFVDGNAPLHSMPVEKEVSCRKEIAAGNSAIKDTGPKIEAPPANPLRDEVRTQAAAAAEPVEQSVAVVSGVVERTADPESLLPWGPSIPTPEMIAISQRAEQTARRGFDLAERGALYTARARFIESLRTVAQAMDAQRNTNAHTKALAAGLRALEEVDDFVPRGTGLETDLNLKLIVDAHHTPVLKDRPLDGVTSMEAQRLYLTYAQEQLSAAAGDQAVASLALYGLGKVCAAPAEMHGPHEQIAECKAVVFYQAAMMVEPLNSLSANELGVLLARFGHLDEARMVLEQSVMVSNAPTSWRNLAVVYQRLGDAPRADQARYAAEAAVAQFQQAGCTSAGLRYPITWLDPETFGRTNSMIGDTKSVVGPQQSPTPAPQTADTSEKKTSSWPWGLK
jgi:tetratricopeptide (TPR) repeat protein